MKNYIILNGKQYNFLEVILMLITFSYLLFSIYLFIKVIPDLVASIENANKSLNEMELTLIEIKRKHIEEIKELQNNVKLLENQRTVYLFDDNSFLKNVNWKHILTILGVSITLFYGYSLYNNFNLITYLSSQSNNLMYFLGIKDERIEFIFQNPELTEHVVRAILKNKSTICDISVRHSSSNEYIPILDYLKSISEVVKQTDNSEAVQLITKEIKNLVIRRN